MNSLTLKKLFPETPQEKRNRINELMKTTPKEIREYERSSGKGIIEDSGD